MLPAAAVAVLPVTGCAASGGGTASLARPSASLTASTPGAASRPSLQRYPDVLSARVTRRGQRTFDVAVTLSSPYDTRQRYADGWRILAPDGEVLAEHTLLHDHASEQPFTRTQSGVEIGPGIDEVTIEGRDLSNGYGGATVTVPVSRD